MASCIGDYGLIGDGHTAALVARDGSIDWLCMPRFDSDACFSALLGSAEHGRWQIGPVCAEAEVRRFYQDDSLVLHHEFATGSGTARLTDFMPPRTQWPAVIRLVTGLSGTVRMRLDLALRFSYGLVPPRISFNDRTMSAVVGPDLVVLHSPVSLNMEDGQARAKFDVTAGDRLAFVLLGGASYQPAPAKPDWEQALAQTLAYWRNWAAKFQRSTPWRDAVMRSLLTLKALIYEPTGGIVAAPTTSLPEVTGGQRNWDYRYCWLRDATFTLAALLNAVYHEEAIRWRDWLLRAIAGSPEKMQIMYRVDGGRRIDEGTIEWLPGYEGAAPVRVGNAAASQRQLDVVGELLDALRLMERAGISQPEEAVAANCELVAYLEQVWHDPDHGLWESRGEARQFTYSKVMCWVGVDRFLSSGAARTQPELRDRLRVLSSRIHSEICSRAWNHMRGHFVERYGGEQLDASLLLLPLVGFLPATDPRMRATIAAIERELTQDGLVWRRLRQEGPVKEGAFIPCSCWLADCLAMQGRRDEAAALLERVIGLRNDLGLLSEEYHPGQQRLIGNFPQALSHIALVNTALGLSGPVLQRGGG